MRQARAHVLANLEAAQGTYLMRLRAPSIAAHARAGQFLHVRCAPVATAGSLSHDPLLRRPLSILRTRRESGELEILYDVVGRGTEYLSRARVGDELDVLGPLGRPFTLKPATRHLLLVSGGIGIVPLVALAEEALARNVLATLVAGFRTAAKVFPAELLPPEVEYVVSTDDGSLGQPGLVTAALGEYLPWADQLCACGPTPMLRAVARLPLPRSLPVQVSLEEHMGCAMGVCLGCVVPTRRGLQRVCRDGPVFELRELGW